MEKTVQIFTIRKKDLDDCTYNSPYTEFVTCSLILEEKLIEKMMKEINLPDNISKFKYENGSFVKEKNMYWLYYDDVCSIVSWLQRLYDSTFGTYGEEDWSTENLEETYFGCLEKIRTYVRIPEFKNLTSLEHSLNDSVCSIYGTNGGLVSLKEIMGCKWNLFDSYVFMRIG